MFADLNKFKVGLRQEEATEIGSIDLVGCYTATLPLLCECNIWMTPNSIISRLKLRLG